MLDLQDFAFNGVQEAQSQNPDHITTQGQNATVPWFLCNPHAVDAYCMRHAEYPGEEQGRAQASEEESLAGHSLSVPKTGQAHSTSIWAALTKYHRLGGF